ITLHGNMLELSRSARARPGSYLWLAARFESLALRLVHGVLCNSRHTAEVLRLRTRRTWLVPNPLRSVFIETPHRVPRETSCCRLLTVGTISANKRQLELLKISEDLFFKRGLRHQWHFIGQADRTDPY